MDGMSPDSIFLLKEEEQICEQFNNEDPKL